jgi:hypothetical protein
MRSAAKRVEPSDDHWATGTTWSKQDGMVFVPNMSNLVSLVRARAWVNPLRARAPGIYFRLGSWWLGVTGPPGRAAVSGQGLPAPGARSCSHRWSRPLSLSLPVSPRHGDQARPARDSHGWHVPLAVIQVRNPGFRWSTRHNSSRVISKMLPEISMVGTRRCALPDLSLRPQWAQWKNLKVKWRLACNWSIAPLQGQLKWSLVNCWEEVR